MAVAVSVASAACGSGEPPVPTQTPVPTPQPGSAQTGRNVLVSLYSATGGENWKSSYRWVTRSSLGMWSGVTTDGDGRVTELHLSSNNLTGRIRPYLGQLTRLTLLNLGNNQLTGSIPPELGRLSNLEQLTLHNTRLSGPVPPELGQLRKLRTLYIPGSSRLTGCVPSELRTQLDTGRSNLGHLEFCE